MTNGINRESCNSDEKLYTFLPPFIENMTTMLWTSLRSAAVNQNSDYRLFCFQFRSLEKAKQFCFEADAENLQLVNFKTHREKNVGKCLETRSQNIIDVHKSASWKC
jgi:hypothetical protein